MNEAIPKRVIILVGPTASGKTEIALKLALELKNAKGIVDAEIISADPMLTYKGFNIGTAKPSPEEQKEVKHHLIDILEPDEVYSAADFAKKAKIVINDLLKENKTPIVVGGTGLYVRILVRGIFEAPKPDWNLRKKLEDESAKFGKEFIYNKLKEIDTTAAKELHKNDLRRIIRAIEIYELTGKPISFWRNFKDENYKFDFILIGLRRSRSDLYSRVNKRVDDMIRNGFIEEVKFLLEKYRKDAPAFNSIGYKELVEFITTNTKETKENVIEKIKRNTRRYVKRQITWFKKEPEIIWIDIKDNDNSEYLTEKVINILEHKNFNKIVKSKDLTPYLWK